MIVITEGNCLAALLMKKLLDAGMLQKRGSRAETGGSVLPRRSANDGDPRGRVDRRNAIVQGNIGRWKGQSMLREIVPRPQPQCKYILASRSPASFEANRGHARISTSMSLRAKYSSARAVWMPRSEIGGCPPCTRAEREVQASRRKGDRGSACVSVQDGSERSCS